MSTAEREVHNFRALDEAVAQGREIRLAQRLDDTTLTGELAKEIRYLQKKYGYTVSSDRTRLIPPGGR
jgi:hypothetical protein